jgi:hypothetical protein
MKPGHSAQNPSMSDKAILRQLLTENVLRQLIESTCAIRLR